MKRLNLFLILLLIPCLLLSFFSCKKKTADAGPFYAAAEEQRALTDKIAVSLGEYDFAAFLNRGCIKISAETYDSTLYGAMDRDGEVVIPAHYSSLKMEGDFFLAEGTLATDLYAVMNRQGETIYTSDNYLEIKDVGGGLVEIRENDERSLLYNDKGEDVLAGTSLDASYEYSACGEYVLAKSKLRCKIFVFRLSTGDTLLKLLGEGVMSYEVAYLGGKDFLVVENTSVIPGDRYQFSVKSNGEYSYINQTLKKYTIGESAPRTLSFDKPIYSLTDRYAFGVTQEERENYPLNEGYFALRYYVTKGKDSDGTLAYCLTDASLNELASLPEGISPVQRMVNGACAVVGESGKLYLVNDKLEVVKTFEDSAYQSVSYSGSVVTASKIAANALRGCYDANGQVVVPFEYSYISDFFGGKAAASKGGKTYLVGVDGSVSYLSDEAFPYYWQGFSVTTVSGKIGLTSFEGKELVSPAYDSLGGVKRVGSEMAVALSADELWTIYRLF